MMRYNILDNTGNVINSIIADQSFVDSAYPGKYELVETFPQPASIVPPKTAFTHLEIMARFTMEELASIYTAAKTTAGVEVWLDMFKLAQEINVTDPQTISGLNSLEAAGLLASGRAAQILATA